MNTAPTDTATLTFSITVDAAPGVTFEQAQDIARNEIILPEVARALVHSTTTSITRRVGQAVGSIPVPTVGSFNLAGQEMGGQDNLARALQTHGDSDECRQPRHKRDAVGLRLCRAAQCNRRLG